MLISPTKLARLELEKEIISFIEELATNYTKNIKEGDTQMADLYETHIKSWYETLEIFRK